MNPLFHPVYCDITNVHALGNNRQGQVAYYTRAVLSVAGAKEMQKPTAQQDHSPRRRQRQRQSKGQSPIQGM